MNTHVQPSTYEAQPARVDGKTAMRLFFEQKAAEHGVKVKVLQTPRKTTPLVLIRQAIIFDLAVAFPKAGATAIGRLIKRDHSAVHNSLRMEAARRGVEVPVTRWARSYDIPQIIAEHDAGIPIPEIARKHGYCDATIIKLIRAHAGRAV
ncbi:hypothetical protein LZK73_18525 [Neorhizobium galegae]|nr:hypothetical protein LZK73_18525 [Neorhizobium galegae]